MTNSRKSRPTRAAIAIEAASLGLVGGVLAWMIAGHPQHPDHWDWLGLAVYGSLTLIYTVALIRLLHRWWASRPSGSPTGYLDYDGDEWRVRPDGYLTLSPSPRPGAPGIALEEVDRDYGPLTPIYG